MRPVCVTMYTIMARSLFASDTSGRLTVLVMSRATSELLTGLYSLSSPVASACSRYAILSSCWDPNSWMHWLASVMCRAYFSRSS